MILLERDLGDGTGVMVCRMMFTYRICLTEQPPLPTGASSVVEGWCYPAELGEVFVLAAARSWDGTGDPPDGWVKQVTTGRRRTGGDPAREYVER